MSGCGLRRRPGSILRLFAGRGDLGRYLIIYCVQLRLGGCSVCYEHGPEALDGAALAPRSDFLARAVGVVAHSLRVRTCAIGFAFDQRRSTAAARAVYSVA